MSVFAIVMGAVMVLLIGGMLLMVLRQPKKK